MSPIVIGSVGTQSGLIGSLIGHGPKAVQTWVAAMNAAGGINCHPIEYIVADDGGDPSTHQAQVRRLVEEEHVIAFVHMNAPLTGNASVDYLTRRSIPVIGSEGASSWFYSSPMLFPQSSSAEYLFTALIAGAAKAALPQGLTRYGQISCVEAPICSGLADTGPGQAKKYGLTPVYNGQASLVQPDFTSLCQNAKRADAEVLFPALDTNSIIRLVKNCDSIGYHPLYVTGTTLATPALAQDSRVAGMLVVWPQIPHYHTDNASLQQLAQSIGAFSPGLDLDADTVNGWTSAKLFERATRDISEPPTSESILKGLWSIQNDDLGGITQPLTFTKGKTATPAICYWTAVIDDGSFDDFGDGSRACD